jgi:ABC-type uncharacterized transport system YnjBCD substrate-binding protein
MLRTADHIAIAGGAVAAALVSSMIAKGILTKADALAIADAAADAAEAARVIAEWRDKFTVT